MEKKDVLELLSSAFEEIQTLTIEPTAHNVGVLNRVFGRLKSVYDAVEKEGDTDVQC